MPGLWETLGRIRIYEFVVRGIVVTATAGAARTTISCWIILVSWSLMGDALSHAVLPGIVIAHTLGVPYSVGAFAAAFLVVGLIFAVQQTSHLRSDMNIGITFTTLFTIGLVFVSKNSSNIDLSYMLFGDLLGITQAGMWQVLILGPLVRAVLLLKCKDLTACAFDPVHLQAIGLPVWYMGALLLVYLAIVVVTAMQMVGTVLIVTLLITPRATTLLITQRFSRMLLIAPALPMASTIADIYVSYWFDTTSGATAVATDDSLFFAMWLTSPHRLRDFLKNRRAAV